MPPPLPVMIRQLIGTPSVSSVNPGIDQGNEAVCELLADWLGDLDFVLEMQPVSAAPAKYNLIATRGRGAGGLVLAGHTDTVPYDEGRWNHDPFGARERDGRLYGLGSADMKSFLALAIEAARRHADSDLQSPLIILATADEESGMSGARTLVEAGRPRARYALIGEPTSLQPVQAHKGIFMEAVRLVGRSGHSSDPDAGRNAIDGMTRVIATLHELRVRLADAHCDERFALPQPTLNFGYIHGGDNPNRICAECELHFDVRLVPGMAIAPTRALVHERVRAALAGTGLEVSFKSLFDGVEPMQSAQNSDLLDACERLTGHRGVAVSFATEAPFLQALGMDTIVMGPGNIAQAHQPDEYIEVASLAPTVDLLERLIGRYCVA